MVPLKLSILIALGSLITVESLRAKTTFHYHLDPNNENGLQYIFTKNYTLTIRESQRGLDTHGSILGQFFVEAALATPQKSVICSPLSALIPLGKLALGATSDTLQELLVAVGLNQRSQLSSKFKPLIDSLMNLPGVKLDMANRIYVNKGLQLDSRFEEEAQDIFQSTVKMINLRNPSKAAKIINHWVEKQTHRKISNLLRSDQIPEGAAAVLVNAVYFRVSDCYIWPILLYGSESWTIKEELRKRAEAFEMWAYRRILRISWTHKITNVEVLRRMNKKCELLQTIKKRKVAYLGHALRHERYELLQLIMMGKVAGKRKGEWQQPFTEAKLGDFHSVIGNQEVPMMTKKSIYHYVQSDVLDSQIIEIPYKGNKASFVMVLPKLEDGLPGLLQALKLAPEALDQEMQKMKRQYVSLTFPKFTTETELDLTQLYRKVGVEKIFTTGLTDMIQGSPVVVSTAIQKAIIEVTETGTMAAAATAMVLYLSMSMEEIIFRADHPFLYFIKAGSEQLFAGVFVRE